MLSVTVDVLLPKRTAIGSTPGGNNTVHIYTQNNTQDNTINNFGYKAFWDSSPEWSN